MLVLLSLLNIILLGVPQDFKESGRQLEKIVLSVLRELSRTVFFSRKGRVICVSPHPVAIFLVKTPTMQPEMGLASFISLGGVGSGRAGKPGLSQAEHHIP